MGASFSYKQIERFMVLMTGTPPEGLSRLQSRLKQWQKLGFPRQERPGRGAKVEYTLGDLVQIYVLYHMLNLGMSLERGIEAVRTSWPDLADALYEVISESREGEAGGKFICIQPVNWHIQPDNDDRPRFRALLLEGRDLALLYSGEFEAPEFVPEAVREAYKATRELGRGSVIHRSVTFSINLIYRDIIIALADEGYTRIADFRAEVATWRLPDPPADTPDEFAEEQWRALLEDASKERLAYVRKLMRFGAYGFLEKDDADGEDS